jgi:hypothetical protein
MTIIGLPFVTILRAVETVTTNFTAFTMHRVHKRLGLYKDKDFSVQSLTSLVQIAKERTIERMENGSPSDEPKLPLHGLTERLTESLEQMHHNIQSLLMQKLGPDARNIIAAERARTTRGKMEKLEAEESMLANKSKAKLVARTLSEAGSDDGDELCMLNAYREQYARMLAELAIARDSLVELEQKLQEGGGGKKVQRQISEDMDELGELGSGRRRLTRRSTSMGISNDLWSKDERGMGKGRFSRRRSTGDSSGESRGSIDPRGFKWNIWKG